MHLIAEFRLWQGFLLYFSKVLKDTFVDTFAVVDSAQYLSSISVLTVLLFGGFNPEIFPTRFQYYFLAVTGLTTAFSATLFPLL